MCNSCEVLNINGINCHETGCPDAWRDYEVECTGCFTVFKPERRGQEFCSDECYQDYWGVWDAEFDDEDPDDYENYASNFDRFSEALGE